MKKLIRITTAFALFFVFNTSAFAQIRINEVGTNGVDFEGATKWVELYNAGDTEENVSNLIFCDFPQYPAINSLAVLAGDVTIPAGGYLVVSWATLDNDNDGDAEVGLYAAGTGDFGDESLMLDYMQYGTGDHARDGTAEDAGLWVDGAFVPAAGAGLSLQFVDNGTPGVGNWVAATPTPNAENPTAEVPIRISEIGFDGVDFDGATKWVELQNTGDTDFDITGLILCDFPDYPTVHGLTALDGGSAIIPAGGFLVVAWPNLDADDDGDAEVGLYNVGTADFDDAGLMLDYMQYGEANHRREGTAVTAGVWETGAFVAAPASGLSLQLVDNAATGVANWVSAPATPNAENNMATSIEEGETPDVFALHANFPNPFNPTTTISYDLERAGQVALEVYDMLGQRVTSLFNGGQAAGSHAYAWDGRDARGNVVSSGVYFYRLTLDGNFSQSRVMTLLK
ncbi:MAG: FlgD immunoglobulin-like domain containing protein [Bacteroidota bacterium]